jgi:hypothetical protein
MREYCTSGSVRGAARKGSSYRGAAEKSTGGRRTIARQSSLEQNDE